LASEAAWEGAGVSKWNETLPSRDFLFGVWAGVLGTIIVTSVVMLLALVL
jgi:hypothetical protein